MTHGKADNMASGVKTTIQIMFLNINGLLYGIT